MLINLTYKIPKRMPRISGEVWAFPFY